MNKNSWVIITEERRVGGMLEAARKLGSDVVAAVVGPRALADKLAGFGFDRVLCIETREGVPVEAYAQQVAEAAATAAPRVVMASDAPVARMLLGAIAAKRNAALIGDVRELAAEGDFIIASRSTAEGKVLEDIEVQGALAAIFAGEDVEIAATQSTPVELLAVGDPVESLRLVETIKVADEDAGMLTAARVVGVGMGLRTKEDLKLIEELAEAMHAEIGCTLPVCNDMRWFDGHSVIGSSHNQIAPELYIGIGISGQPHHTSGIRDAKVVVAINQDPEAKIFKVCDYGIVGDLYKIVPVLTSEFQRLDEPMYIK